VLGSGVYRASNRYEYQKQKKKKNEFGGVERRRRVRLTTSPPPVNLSWKFPSLTYFIVFNGQVFQEFENLQILEALASVTFSAIRATRNIT
jgi:hypothetical protein